MESKVEKTKCNFKLGQFKTVKKVDDDVVETLVEPLTQNDYADGWSMVLPKGNKTSTRHHFNVFLSQLPPHLWGKIRFDSKDNYLPIEDNIYLYTIKKTDMDDTLFQLYDMMNCEYNHDNHDNISKLYNELNKQNVRGWIMLRAKSVMSGNLTN